MVSAVDKSNDFIHVRNVNFSYGSDVVLKDITLDIRKGDFLAIIGPNGSGKTTLIKIILRMLKPDSGSVSIFGRAVESFDDWNKIGYVPQNATHIDPYFPASVQEVVSMGLLASRRFSWIGQKKEEDEIQWALQQVDMENCIERRIGNLSGGQQQRVFIARAIVNHPQVLFLDEPTTGVDAATQEHFYDMLNELNRDQSITIVLITHETGILNRHINKVACLNQTLVYHGTHSEFCSSEAFKKMLDNGHHIISHRH
jgi:zinc transport system ATP-binding protein